MGKHEGHGRASSLKRADVDQGLTLTAYKGKSVDAGLQASKASAHIGFMAGNA